MFGNGVLIGMTITLRCRFPTRQVRKPALAAYCGAVRGVTMDGVRVPLTADGTHPSIVTITSDFGLLLVRLDFDRRDESNNITSGA